jgi:hypothetical protein
MNLFVLLFIGVIVWFSCSKKPAFMKKQRGGGYAPMIGGVVLVAIIIGVVVVKYGLGTSGASITGIAFSVPAAAEGGRKLPTTAGGTLSAKVTFNKAVDVTGNPTLSVTNSGGGTLALAYTGGTGSAVLTFSATTPLLVVTKILTIGADPVALSGGTIKDKGTDTVSTITSSSSIGTTAGTVTVIAATAT